MAISTSSLLRSAAARRAKIRALEDSEIAFQWENSAQTYEDFQSYSKYLNDRAVSSSDPSDQLSYQRKLRSARRSFTSNELQRQQMAIMEGRASTQDKMAAVKELYDQAIDNGDMNLAQNLFSQWDSLSIKLQNEQETAARAFSSSGKDAFEKLEKELINNFDDVTLPNGQVVTPLAAISEYFAESGDTVEAVRAAEETLEALGAVIADRYQSGTITESEAIAMEKKYGQGLRNLYKELKINVGGTNLSYEDVVSAIANDQFNNPLYGLKAVRNEATGQTEFKLKTNNVERIDYVRQIDEQGQEYYVPASIRTDREKLLFGSSDQGRGLDTQIDDSGAVIGGDGSTRGGKEKGKRDDSQTIRNRLKTLGIEAETDGTTLKIKLPGENVERTATIEPDGSLRYFDDGGQIIEVGLVERNLGSDSQPMNIAAGQPRVVSPEELSDFGSRSAFGGTLSQTSLQGRRYIDDLTGKTKAQPIGKLAGPINIANDFSGAGTAATSNLLQTAGAIRQANQIEKQRQAMLQAGQEPIQASNTLNLNQTPVQQFTSNGIMRRQLRVATPAPTPRVYVSPARTLQRLTGVSVARPTSRITGVEPLPAMPRVRVY